MKINWRTEIVQWVILAAMFLAVFVCWSGVPERIPTHWNSAGEIDGYGGRFIGLLLLPLTALGLYGLFLVLPLIDPGKLNYEGFGRVYVIIRTTVMIYFGVLHATTLAIALGNPVNMTQVITVAMGVMFIVLGNYLGKVRPNWFVGVRTPWTLSSKLSWNKTHRLAGWLFVASGVLALVSGALRPQWGVFVMLGTLLPSSLTMVIYSYVVWRSDPDRVSPAGTSPSVANEETAT